MKRRKERKEGREKGGRERMKRRMVKTRRGTDERVMERLQQGKKKKGDNEKKGESEYVGVRVSE